ncbi:MAG: 2-oxo acid dehydrogenase subunit E2, partial [Dehalococcoidia bacterium]
RGKSLGALTREARDVAVRAREGRLRPAELNDGTFTVSNLGMYGVETLRIVFERLSRTPRWRVAPVPRDRHGNTPVS